MLLLKIFSLSIPATANCDVWGPITSSTKSVSLCKACRGSWCCCHMPQRQHTASGTQRAMVKPRNKLTNSKMQTSTRRSSHREKTLIANHKRPLQRALITFSLRHTSLYLCGLTYFRHSFPVSGSSPASAFLLLFFLSSRTNFLLM